MTDHMDGSSAPLPSVPCVQILLSRIRTQPDTARNKHCTPNTPSQADNSIVSFPPQPLPIPQPANPQSIPSNLAISLSHYRFPYRAPIERSPDHHCPRFDWLHMQTHGRVQPLWGAGTSVSFLSSAAPEANMAWRWPCQGWLEKYRRSLCREIGEGGQSMRD